VLIDVWAPTERALEQAEARCKEAAHIFNSFDVSGSGFMARAELVETLFGDPTRAAALPHGSAAGTRQREGQSFGTAVVHERAREEAGGSGGGTGAGAGAGTARTQGARLERHVSSRARGRRSVARVKARRSGAPGTPESAPSPVPRAPPTASAAYDVLRAANTREGLARLQLQGSLKDVHSEMVAALAQSECDDGGAMISRSEFVELYCSLLAQRTRSTPEYLRAMALSGAAFMVAHMAEFRTRSDDAQAHAEWQARAGATTTITCGPHAGYPQHMPARIVFLRQRLPAADVLHQLQPYLSRRVLSTPPPHWGDVYDFYAAFVTV